MHKEGVTYGRQSLMWTAIGHCVRHNIPFACAALPGVEDLEFFASSTVNNSQSHTSDVCLAEEKSFGISLFDSPNHAVWIKADIDAKSALEDDAVYPGPQITPVNQSTTFAQYSRQAQTLIGLLERTGGKTVLSTVIAVKSDKSITEVIKEYFSRFPSTMRYVYFTAQTGLWFGASPELILDFDRENRKLLTMSLAGTRLVSESHRPWDSKNLREHQFVTDFILDNLKAGGLQADIIDSTPLLFGDIQHLCDIIQAHDVANPVNVLCSLSPTPALCGYPREEATAQIHALEGHSRHCYGGWLALADKDGLHAYVNLRCAFAAPQTDGSVLYNIYAGGGLTSDSDVSEEWAETRAKAKILYECITK